MRYLTDPVAVARTATHAHKTSLERRIVSTGSPREIYEFARYVPGADIDALRDALERTGDNEHLDLFHRYVK